MIDSRQLQTTLYEIAMHIGTTPDPHILAQDAIFSFVRQLDCSGALLCQQQLPKGESKPFFMTPKNLFSHPKTGTFLSAWCERVKNKGDLQLPFSITHEQGVFYHLFPLKGFGALILLRNTEPFSETLLKALLPVCHKLANALSTSLKAEENSQKIINFKTLIDTMSEGMALFDESLHCVEINESALEKFSYQYDDAIGRHIFDVISKSDHAKLLALNKQEDAKSEWTLVKKDGTTFPAFVSGSNIIYKEKPTRIVTFIDLTEVKEREKQLYQQSRLAQMGEMLSMIAHQWRQPLAAISASTIGIKTKIQMEKFDLSTQEGQDAQSEYLFHKLDNISSYVEHLSATIEDFRNFFKPNKSKSVLNLEEIIQKAIHILKPALIEHHVSLQTDIHFKHNIETYNNELLQALLNILKNSIDHFLEVKHPSPIIYIQGFEEADAFIIKIQDNAGGIPETILENIFDPYFSTKDEKNGTGLGLYMTKTIIEDHCEGKIHVSNYKDGAEFKIILKSPSKIVNTRN